MFRVLLFILCLSPLSAGDSPLLKHILSEMGPNANLDRAIQEQVTANGTPLIRGQRVLFLAPAVDQIAPRVLGDFNMWGFVEAATRDQDEAAGAMIPIKGSDWFAYEIELLPAARVEYQLTYGANQDAKADPNNRASTTTWGSVVSQVVMPGYQPPRALQPLPQDQSGRVVELKLNSAVMGETRDIKIYLPPGYDGSDQRYPTAYFGDGNTYMDEVRTPLIMDQTIASGRMRPIIAVFVEPVNRGAEYRMNPNYQRFVADELRTHVDAHYRTIPKPEARLVLGGSRGGLAAAYVAGASPEVFGLCVPISPALAPTPLTTFLKAHQPQKIRWYVIAGVYDVRWLPDARALRDLLRERGADVTYREFPEGHNLKAWGTYMDDILAAMFPPVR